MIYVDDKYSVIFNDSNFIVIDKIEVFSFEYEFNKVYYNYVFYKDNKDLELNYDEIHLKYIKINEINLNVLIEAHSIIRSFNFYKKMAKTHTFLYGSRI